MELIELRLLDTEKNYDPSLIKNLVSHYNHNQSASISLDDFKHNLDTIDYILEHGKTLEEGMQSIQSDIKEIQRIYESIKILPIHNEKYLNVLENRFLSLFNLLQARMPYFIIAIFL